MKVFITILVILIVGAGLWYVFEMSPGDAAPKDASINTGSPTPTTTPSPTPTPINVSKTIKVEMTSAGFSPKELTINAGDTIQFINKDTRDWWPASSKHPTHLVCPGFDSSKGMKPGETYSHKFPTAMECPMHDHLMPTLFGKIIIQ